ncbi:MAG: PEP/pyruvate-binding domain-containing protein [Desulfopila sp.]|jgi:pyruvate,water dikinase|nr:PEP/pyruvate-binding domain-containing protein [Desulfopila sp.]
MKVIYFPDSLQTTEGDLRAVIGGKGQALFKLYNSGLPVPRPVCIGTVAYEQFVAKNHLREKINLLLHRKDLKETRWEEIWDISLRIQNLFLNGRYPAELRRDIKELVRVEFKNKPVVIRSSAPGEDGGARSFAGLHDSYLNVAGIDQVLQKIKKVWASLWSDRAILYRQELGLEVASSTIAVVIQEFIEGESSGVVFSKSPLNASQLIIEAVYGLNQGLVDGDVEPDRWILDRSVSEPPEHSSPTERKYQFLRCGNAGVCRQLLQPELQAVPPLDEKQVRSVVSLGIRLEKFFDMAQDVEWTLRSGHLYILQSRPVTARKNGEDRSDKRSWYLSLNRSYDNLLLLWENITEKLLPEMDDESNALERVVLQSLTDGELADELLRRDGINERWTSVYWNDFIPFAHGVRLFGEMYNDVVEPVDPFEFVALLTGQEMLSTERNQLLLECARMVSADDSLRSALLHHNFAEIDNQGFVQKLALLKSRFSMAGPGMGEEKNTDALIAAMILQYSSLNFAYQQRRQGVHEDSRQLESQFVAKAREKLPVDPEKLLEMARASYRIRDDDNIHIGRIAQELERAKAHARKRLQNRGILLNPANSVKDLSKMLEGYTPSTIRRSSAVHSTYQADKKVRARQLQGQPASSGIGRGKARVIASGEELKDFKKGEVLVIDSIDPTMTFLAPLAAGIVERRGGMLIHGAIIAREYGIPCITGVVNATLLIETGDFVTVDGYLGMCTVQRKE